MSITLVILLLCIAIGLILIEIFLIPGVGIPGIAGIALMAGALILAYQVNTITGHYTLAATVLASLALMALALRAKTWDRLSQKEEIRGRVNNTAGELKVGDRGTCVSRLNPIGTVRIGEALYEARSRGEYISEQTPVEIINIEGTKITVKSTQS